MRRTSSFINNINRYPFEILIAGLAIISGLVGLLHAGLQNNVLDKLLQSWQVVFFNISYLVAGLCLVAGLGIPRRDIEGAGLVLIIMSVVVRSFAELALLGINGLIVTSLLFNFMVIIACTIRILQLLKKEIIIKIGELPEE
ncbi:MAG TPA: hypothetical protein VNU45_05200 [Rummeliibacillus sp.]|nr:hypothetical protein [Rummeliibacillus sp.]